MSLFRKPKKIQRRMFCAEDENDEGEPEPPPPPIISKEKEKNSTKTKSLLSFADEEDNDGEVFKVKKSSQSKRLAKRREKEKRKPPDGDNYKYDNNVHEDNGDIMEVDEKPKLSKKKVTLEGLILSGREALATEASDGSGSDRSEGVDEGGFHTYRAESVRAALRPGRIPDAALIHAARKTRQQARELGGDYIPIGRPSEAQAGSRLIREDGSGDEDEDEGRLIVRGLELPSDKPQRGTAAEQPDEEVDSEVEQWEEQQMQKAMPAIADAMGEAGIEVNPFSVAPPPPQIHCAASYLRPLLPPPTSAQLLLEALTARLQELKMDRDSTATKVQELRDRLLFTARVRENRAARCAELDAAYKRAQEARGYLTDLIECLDEKMPQLEALESRALVIHRRRCEFLVERRRADVRDQAQDVLALAARPGAAKQVDSEEKIRRAAEREGRRRARRLKREGAAAAHRDGDSSDDDLPPHQQQQHATERESIRLSASQLFSDALPAWRSVRGVCGTLARWRRRSPTLYADAYVADCLPKLLAPYVRHQLILWNPLADEDNEDYERMDWYKCLMMYGVKCEKITDSDSESEQENEVSVTESSVRQDPDLMLVPALVSRVVLPKLTELVEHAWDPVCVRACIRLRSLLWRLSSVVGSRAALQRLAAAVRVRVVAALNADVFLPALPPQIIDGAGGVFWRRCLGAGVRLLRAILSLTAPPEVLRADPHALALIETLCCAAGAAPAPQMSSAAAALSETLPRAGTLRRRALARLAALAQLALSRLQSDNPLHLKALEQARMVIAEAKASE